MAKVAPPKNRATVTETADGIELATPARKNWFLIVFLGAWMVGWVLGEVSAGRELMAPEGLESEARLFMLVWLIGWTMGGLAAFGLWIWTLAGVERAKIVGGSITLRREVLGIGLNREYDSSHITNLRVTPDTISMFDPRAGLRMWGFGGGPIAFDYGSRTIRFGSGLEEAEAKQHVAQVLRRFSRYRPEVF